MRGFRTLKRGALAYLCYKIGRPKLVSAVFYVTARCNLRCVFCSRWKKNEGELTKDEALKVIDKLCDAGVTYINYSGGEPLLRDDLEEIASRSKDCGCINTLSTNGTLITPARAKSLGKVFDGITVSLDGFEDVHDRTRGIKGTYLRALKGLKYLKKYSGVNVGIATTIYRENWASVIKLFKKLEGLVDYVSFQPIGGTLERPYPPVKELSVPLGKVGELAKELSSFKRVKGGYVVDPLWFIKGLEDYFKGKMKIKLCDAGRLYIGVNWRGELMLCPIREDTIAGSLLERELNELLAQNDAWDKVRTCPGCWSQCTTIISMIFRHRLSETLLDIKDMIGNWSGKCLGV